MTNKKEICVSADADGSLPGPYSILNFGSVAFGLNYKRIGITSCCTEVEQCNNHKTVKASLETQ